MSHLLATPHGLTLAGVILAKRSPNGTFNIRGREKEIHAQLQAAYGKAVTPQAMRYIVRGCELLAKVSDQELEQAGYPFHPNPYAKLTIGNDFSDMTKALMMFALSGLNDMEKIPEGKARLLKMQDSIHHDSLLKSYGLPTWEELTKDDSDDEDDGDEGDDSDSGTSAGGEATDYLRDNAEPGPTRYCASYVTDAIRSTDGGGLTDLGYSADAKNYGPVLEAAGFVPVASATDVNSCNQYPLPGYTPQAGDVVVIQPYPGGNASGHMAMYDGTQWISDFVQIDMWGGKGRRAYAPPYVIYRYPSSD